MIFAFQNLFSFSKPFMQPRVKLGVLYSLVTEAASSNDLNLPSNLPARNNSLFSVILSFIFNLKSANHKKYADIGRFGRFGSLFLYFPIWKTEINWSELNQQMCIIIIFTSK